jgi:hypothetical protein
MHSAALAAALVALCSGATAAPIAANLRIEPTEISFFSPGPSAGLSLSAFEVHRQLSLEVTGEPLVPTAAIADLPEPPNGLMSAGGLGFVTLLLWRRRTQGRRRRRRRRTELQLRQIAPIL